VIFNLFVKIVVFSFLLLICFSPCRASEWLVWKQGNIRVWASPKDKAYADYIVEKLNSRIESFQMHLGVYPERYLILKILPNEKEYRSVTSGKGKIVESSKAFYSPRENVIYVRSPEQLSRFTYDDVLMHEYVHWFLNETLSNTPLWFHEGMAMYYSGQFGFESYINFTRYRFMGYRLSLNQMMHNYPDERYKWDMFYLTSVFAVNYLLSSRNREWQRFWDSVGYKYNRYSHRGEKIDFIDAYNHAFKSDMYELNREFDKVLSRFGWQFPLVGINALILAFLPLIIILGWIKNRRKLNALEDKNEPDDNFTPEEVRESIQSPDDEEKQD